MNKRTYASLIPAVVLILITLIMTWAEHGFTSQLTDQFLAGRWSKEEPFSQVSCFFSEEACITEEQLVPLRYKINEALVNAAVDSQEQTGRNLVEAYSSIGTLSIASVRTSASVRAVGVGGDFFLFHPMKLLSGSYFDGTDVNGDGVIIDEDVAWKLFGSSQVDGMEIIIDDAVYPVRGVVRRESGKFSEAAEEDEPTIYVSYKILQGQAESAYPIENYELLVNSPVTGFGVKTLKEALGIDEKSYEIIENSSRFSIAHRVDLLRNFGIRSMKKNGIRYPYWENRARAYEDVSTLFMVLEGILLIYPILYITRQLIELIRRIKKFSIRLAMEKLLMRIKGKKNENHE